MLRFSGLCLSEVSGIDYNRNFCQRQEEEIQIFLKAAIFISTYTAYTIKNNGKLDGCWNDEHSYVPHICKKLWELELTGFI